jgi:hypothetical protein
MENTICWFTRIADLRQLYSKYCRSIILDKISNSCENKMILIISYYDTASNVINVLKWMGIDLDGKFRKGPVVVMDSVNAYSCSNLDQSSERADDWRRNGNTIDMCIW